MSCQRPFTLALGLVSLLGGDARLSGGDRVVGIHHGEDGRLLHQPPLLDEQQRFVVHLDGINENGQAVLVSEKDVCPIGSDGNATLVLSSSPDASGACAVRTGPQGTFTYTLLRKVDAANADDVNKGIESLLKAITEAYERFAERTKATEPWPKLELIAPICPTGSCGPRELDLVLTKVQEARERCSRYQEQLKAAMVALVHDELARRNGLKVAAALGELESDITLPLTKLKEQSPRLKGFFTRAAQADCYRTFQGELLVGGPRAAVAFERDASFVGNVTAEYFRLNDGQTVYFFVQDRGTSTARYEVSVKATPKTQPIVRTMTAEGEDKVTPGDEASIALCKTTALAPPTWELRRASQGARFPGESEALLTLNAEEGTPSKLTSRVAASLEVAGTYRIGVNTGLVVSNLVRPSFFNNSDGKVADKGGRKVILPMFNVTYFVKPRSYMRYRAIDFANWIPSPVVGFRLDSPGSDVFYGLSTEPVRGVQILVGRNRGARNVLLDPPSIGDEALVDTAGKPRDPVTKETFQEDWAWGVTFDVNLFADKLLKLAGF